MAGGMRGGYTGAEWPAIVDGRCVKHKQKVGPLGVCYLCHREQLDAAGIRSAVAPIALPVDEEPVREAAVKVDCLTPYRCSEFGACRMPPICNGFGVSTTSKFVPTAPEPEPAGFMPGFGVAGASSGFRVGAGS